MVGDVAEADRADEQPGEREHEAAMPATPTAQKLNTPSDRA